MTLSLCLGIFLVSGWILARSMGGLIDDQRSDAGLAARNRTERHRGLQLAEVLTRKAELLSGKAGSGTQQDTATIDTELAALDNRITEIEGEYEPMLARETRREERIRSAVYTSDLVFSLLGVAGMVVAVIGFIVVSL